jgi:predicted transcriptional regulator
LKDFFVGVRIKPETKEVLVKLAKKDQRSVSFIIRQELERLTKTGKGQKNDKV